MDNQRNMILAIVLSALVLFGWSAISRHYFPTANPPVTKTVDGKQVALPNPAADAPAVLRDRAVVLAETPRLKIDTPAVAGSINLKGLRLDDLVLKKHRETIDEKSPPIRLLSPGGAAKAYFANFGWTGEGLRVPGNDTVWQTNATVLTPAQPATLFWDNGEGQRFEVTVAVDADYLFTITQRVANHGASAVAARPFALVSRVGKSTDPDGWTMHTGPISYWDGQAHFDVNYPDLDKQGAEGTRFSIADGWLGFGDKYWLTALVPDAKSTVDAALFARSTDNYTAVFNPPSATLLAPGKAATTTSRFFAGAKDVSLLERYDREGITRLNLAIDWGWFRWFEVPIFHVLDWLFKLVGNFGVAILLLTFIVRGLMFPIAQKQFASMAGMRALQPKMKALQERYKDDKPKLQQEMLSLYKTEKVNPLAGCLPMVLQVPIFYALYKVLMLTIEMRHQPFIWWVHDLSAPDPMTPVNLFGLLNFTPPAFLALGVLPILVGITMYLQFKLNPAPTDEIQKQVFGIMPWILMFVMAPFAAGLQLYWVMSNTLTILQQKWLYSRHPALLAAEGKQEPKAK